MLVGAIVIGYMISTIMDLAKSVNESKRNLDDKLSRVHPVPHLNCPTYTCIKNITVFSTCWIMQIIHTAWS